METPNPTADKILNLVRLYADKVEYEYDNTPATAKQCLRSNLEGLAKDVVDIMLADFCDIFIKDILKSVVVDKPQP